MLTNTLHAANMKIGHVRGIQDRPVSLTGNPDEDRLIMEAEIRRAVEQVLPLVQRADIRWRPSGRTADVSISVAGKRTRIATFALTGAA